MPCLRALKKLNGNFSLNRATLSFEFLQSNQSKERERHFFFGIQLVIPFKLRNNRKCYDGSNNNHLKKTGVLGRQSPESELEALGLEATSNTTKRKGHGVGRPRLELYSWHFPALVFSFIIFSNNKKTNIKHIGLVFVKSIRRDNSL